MIMAKSMDTKSINVLNSFNEYDQNLYKKVNLLQYSLKVLVKIISLVALLNFPQGRLLHHWLSLVSKCSKANRSIWSNDRCWSCHLIWSFSEVKIWSINTLWRFFWRQNCFNFLKFCFQVVQIKTVDI